METTATGMRQNSAMMKSKAGKNFLRKRLANWVSKDRDSVDSNDSRGSTPELVDLGKSAYRVLILGAANVGKTAIISQFLYDNFSSDYKGTVDEMYHGEFTVGTSKISLDIQDTGGSYVGDFPAMVKCSLASADAVLLVYSVACLDSFDYLSGLRDLVQQERGEGMPVVVVGNKTDLERQIPREEAEATVLCDWENGYVECCAKDNLNVPAVFRALLVQAKSPLLLMPSIQAPVPVMRRRKSLPQISALSVVQQCPQPVLGAKGSRLSKRRGSLMPTSMPSINSVSPKMNKRRDSCRQQ